MLIQNLSLVGSEIIIIQQPVYEDMFRHCAFQHWGYSREQVYRFMGNPDFEKLMTAMKYYRKGKIREDTTFGFYSQSIRGGVQDGADLAWCIRERPLRF